MSESESATGLLRGQPVFDSPELRRILALPRRQRPSDEQLASVGAVIESHLGKGNVNCECVSKYHRACCKHLLPTQVWALMEIAATGGLLGPIGVGHGKTLLDLLAPLVVDKCRTAALLVKPGLRNQLMTLDWAFYGQHWQLPSRADLPIREVGKPLLHIVAYSQLSGTKSSDLLDGIEPDTIICDEAHCIAASPGKRSVRAGRLRRYLSTHPSTRMLLWSGTLTKRQLQDWADFSTWALGEGSPVPRDYPTLEQWGAALNPSDWPAPYGALEKLRTKPTQSVQEAFTERNNSTLGVVSSGDADSCEAELNIYERKVQLPEKVDTLIKSVDATWQRPDGEELVQAVDVADTERELSAGFYYRWIWPRGEPKAVIDAWLDARRSYNGEVREFLKHRSREQLDSPALLRAAGERWLHGYMYDGKSYPKACRTGPLPVWQSEHLARWIELEDTAKPQTEAVWVDDFLIQDAAMWLRDNVGVCWYLHTAWGARLEAATGVTRHGAGPEASANIIRETGKRPIIASIKAHYDGKNLQMFHESLVANPPSAGDVWEQLLGRSHRQGQLAEEVNVHVYRHTKAMRDAIDKAKDLALYIQGTFGARQKLVSRANWAF